MIFASPDFIMGRTG